MDSVPDILSLFSSLRLSLTHSIYQINKNNKTQSERFNNDPLRTKLLVLFIEKHKFQLKSRILLSYPIIKISLIDPSLEDIPLPQHKENKKCLVRRLSADYSQGW